MDFPSWYESNPELWEYTPSPPPAQRLVWGMTDDGIPIDDPQGVSGLMTQEEFSHVINRVKGRFRCQWLDLTNPQDLQTYEDIWQKATDGWYLVCGVETMETKEPGRCYRLVSWLERWRDIPDFVVQNVMSNGSR